VRGCAGRRVHGTLVVELPVRPPVDRGGQLGIVDHDPDRTRAAAGGGR
jgi:hypothetical protein